MTQLMPNLWWELSTAILVWWLGIRLINVFTPACWSNSFLNHILFRLSMLSSISDNSRLQLASGIKGHKLWYQARGLLLAVPQVGKMLAPKLIHHFYSHWAHLDSGLCCHLITSLLILPIRRLNSLSDFQTGIGAGCHATLDTEHLISHTRAAFDDTVTSEHGCFSFCFLYVLDQFSLEQNLNFD